MLKRLPRRVRSRIASATDFDVVRNLRNQDHIRPAGKPRAEREPAGAMPHDFDNDDAVVARRGRVQAVDGLRDDVQRGVKAERTVGHRECRCRLSWAA